MNINFMTIYTFSIFSTLIRNSLEEHVLPVSQGLWYNEAKFSGVDACLSAYYNYSEFFPTQEDVLRNANIPYYADCTWEYDKATYYNNSVMPYGFIGTPDDWHIIILDPNATLGGFYHVDCYDQNGLKKEYAYVYVYPFYWCPPSSRLTYYDNFTLEEGCSTTPMPCVADIVARDLNYTGLGWLGHVGLVTSLDQNPDIVEVLNGTNPDICGIFLDPLYGNNSFSTKTEYWGERYGIFDRVNGNYTLNLDLSIADDMIDLAIAQSHYFLKYTLSWSYYPGGTEADPEYCKFRCDSFVYYLYKTLGLSIEPTFSFPLTPQLIYHEFLCSADPMESCPYSPVSHTVSTKQVVSTQKLMTNNSLNIPDTIKCKTTLKLEIFSNLRSVLYERNRQKYELAELIKKYQVTQSSEELLARCICFELAKMRPDQIDHSVKSLLLNLLLAYKKLMSDNFSLATITNGVRFFYDNPLCRWPNAYFTVNSESQYEKETKIISFIDEHPTAVEQAHLISATRLSLFKSLSQRKKCEYGGLFFYAYNREPSLSNGDKKILMLGLAEMGYPRKEVDIRHSVCFNSSSI